MNVLQKLLMALGAAFAGIGLIFTVVLGSALPKVPGSGPMVMIVIPIFFILIGLSLIIFVLTAVAKKKEVAKKGKKYSAKIYGYVENTSVRVNSDYLIDTKVHYFDEKHIEREAIIPTGFNRGSSQYPIGMTIDIYEYNGKYSFDPKSVRDEILPGENELMDDKPIEPERITNVAIECKNCGATFQAVKGYTERCPYCGSIYNA
ncbi:MAG: hydrogenase maturation nickel metallochaperone HypA [Lachnospiraceae bacterium]|nr:hydrogenase maturation nickel metallochaperone HypA [Lachnospiraceae bacterium]